MTALFVTSTGTDIGKTFVARGMIRELRGRGRAVEALKPVITGFDPRLAHASDTGRLLSALGRPLTPDHIAAMSRYRLREPVSPDLAARSRAQPHRFRGARRAVPRRDRAAPRCADHRGHRRHHGAARRSPHRARLDDRDRPAAAARRRQLCGHAEPYADGPRRPRTQRSQGRRRRRQRDAGERRGPGRHRSRRSAASPRASKWWRCLALPRSSTDHPVMAAIADLM